MKEYILIIRTIGNVMLRLVLNARDQHTPEQIYAMLLLKAAELVINFTDQAFMCDL